MKHFLTASLFAAVLAPHLHAQSFFTTPTNQYLTPSFRGTGNSEASRWDVFYSPTGLNYPDIAAPNGIGSPSSETPYLPPSDASPFDPYAFWNPANPTIQQTGTNTAFIIGAGATGNIYSPDARTAYQLLDSTPYSLGTVVMQFQTDGTLPDFSKLTLVANNVTYTPTNIITEYKASGSSFGGLTNRTAVQWNLSGATVSSYQINLFSSDPSMSLQEVLLDTAATYTEAVPSARTLSAANGSWSQAATWAGAKLPATGGNIDVASGSSVTVDGGTQTIGELQLSAPGSFAVNATSGGVLKINTGLTATPASATTYSFNAPVLMGSFNRLLLNDQTTVDFNQPISGATGLYITGGGKVRLNAANTFTGPLTLDGGTLEISGSNAYTGATTVLGGTLVLKANALATGAGALGNSGSLVTVGSDGTAAANLVIDGAFTVGRSLAIGAGANLKSLGGRNTGAGATYAGGITLNTAASNVQLAAEAVSDRVSFTGALTGGVTTGTLTKTGAGTVVLGGGTNKNYLNATVVQAGTLELATGTVFSGTGNFTVAAGASLVVNGNLNVAAGASLLVHGSLTGSGNLSINAGLIGGAGSIQQAFLLDTGDTLSPGAGVGTLHTLGQTWANGAKLKLELGRATGTAGTDWDLVTLDGTLDLSASAGGFTLQLQTLAAGSAGLLAGFDKNTSYTWKFASASSVTNFAASGFTIDKTGFANSLSGSFFVSQSNGDLLLNYQAIPEPSSALLLGSGLWLLARRRRRGTAPAEGGPGKGARGRGGPTPRPANARSAWERRP